MRPVLLLLLLLALLVVAMRRDALVLPARLDPRAPLEVDGRGPFDGLKLRRLARDGAACRRFLADAGVRFEPLPDRDFGAGCGWRDAVRVRRLGTLAVGDRTMACALAARLARYERLALQPIAQRAYGEPIVAVRDAGTYACRNRNHRAHAPRSTHARAEAWDVHSFRTHSGRVLDVARDFRADSHAGATLRALKSAACRDLPLVLGPDHDRAHADHFHLEAARGRACR